MLKFSRYFFIIFLIMTITPLLLMFCWHGYQIEQDMHKKEDGFFNIGFKQLEYATNDYLKIQEENTQRIIDNLPKKLINLNQYKNIFDADNAYLITSDNKIIGTSKPPLILNKLKYQNTRKIIGSYELLTDNKNEIVTVIDVPFNQDKYKRLILIDKINFNKLYPHGPFNLEVYSGSKIESNKLITTIKDPFLMPPRSPFKNPPFGHEFDKMPLNPPPIKNIPSKKLNIKDRSGNTIALLLLKMQIIQPPMNSPLSSISLIILLGGAVFSLLSGFYIKQNFVNPFLLISTASKKVQEGDLSFQLTSNVKHKDISETIKRFNSMIEELKEKQELRVSFITNLTHDLKTPLIAQERAIELIIKEFEKLNLTEQLKLAKGIDKNNKHLLRMVSLLLESYHFDSNNINLKITNINLHNLIEQCFEQLNSLASTKNINLKNNVPNDIILQADINSIKRVCLNIMANAIDNIQNNKDVKITAMNQNTNIKIIIEDNGHGISPKDLNFLFDRYYTGKSDERKIGSGLGLYVCKQLVELHKGSISVESEINNFTRFTIILPSNSNITMEKQS
ncbi:MAG: HAMP domain-containing sensor histidine kinase [bacterium]